MKRTPLGVILPALLLVLPAFLGAQSSSTGSQTLGSAQLPGVTRSMQLSGIEYPSMSDGHDASRAEKRLSMMNAERQKTLVDDTNKLLALAKELNGEIAQSNTGELTPEQLRKVAEIEKLAHSVRDKMSLSVRYESPGLDMGPVFPPYR
jgi:hypothetical protein